MALIQVNYMSRALFRIVPLYVILPADKFDADTDRYLQQKEKNTRRCIFCTAFWEIIRIG